VIEKNNCTIPSLCWRRWPAGAALLAEAMGYFEGSYPRERSARLARLPQPNGRTRAEWDPFDELDEKFYRGSDGKRLRWELAADSWICNSPQERDREANEHSHTRKKLILPFLDSGAFCMRSFDVDTSRRDRGTDSTRRFGVPNRRIWKISLPGSRRGS
jgi:hypothetical protein